MKRLSLEGNLSPDVDELILMGDPGYVGDTYIFEPSPGEEHLGYLFAAVEIENREGTGKELLDTALQSLQREYFREPSRGVLASFESALHQANLILHDVAERGMRDWMGYFHAACGVLAYSTLHISTAGNAAVLLVRRSRVAVVSVGLSHSPITDPLRTFSQVASGMVTKHDMLLLVTSRFEQLFRHEDVARFAITHSASTVALRLKQLYEDQGEQLPVAVLAVCLLPKRAAPAETERQQPVWQSRRAPVEGLAALAPRQPLVIRRSFIKRFLLLLGRITLSIGHWIASATWLVVTHGGRRSGQFLRQVSSAAHGRMRRSAKRLVGYSSSEQTSQPAASWLRFSPKGLNLTGWRSVPRWLVTVLMVRFRALPLSSKLLAIVTLVLTVTLIVSFVLLQKKRVEDRQVQRASELLHEARTKKDAAEAALIYDNRDQARTLLSEATKLSEDLTVLGLYQDQSKELATALAAARDRLEKVLRITGEVARTLGDFGNAFADSQPSSLYFVDGRLYTFDPANNTIATLDESGTVNVVSKTSQGIGYFKTGAAHEADKMLILVTDEPGAALFDTKTSLLQKQEISLPLETVEVRTIATFGNRLYLYDRAAHNIFSYNKTLRGYAGGAPWITDDQVPRDNIVSISIDGFIYSLHEDGTIRKLYKGAAAEFTQEAVQPPLQRADRLLTGERLLHLYVLDRSGQRVVVFDKKGELKRQIFLESATAVADIAVNADETTLYVLDGTRVLAVSLVE